MRASFSSPPLACWRFLAIFLAVLAGSLGQEVFINEIHYENEGVDRHEGVEILGPAGIPLRDYQLAFYNGSNGEVYLCILLSGILPDEMGTGFGARFFEISGIQNGSPDGVALFRDTDGQVLQFLAYEGSFRAVDGPASGLVATPISVAEGEHTSGEHSLQLRGTGSRYEDFTWADSIPRSPNAINPQQHLTGAATARIVLAIAPESVEESAGESAAKLDVFLEPPPSTPTRLVLKVQPEGRLAIPDEARVSDASGATVWVDVLDNDLRDLEGTVTIRVEDPDAFYRSAAVEIRVLDDDPPETSSAFLRVASLNVLNGVGPSTSVSFDAVRRILARLNADVIAFQEVSDADDFGQLAHLLDELGYGTDPAHFVARGEGFEEDAPANGDFGGNQHVALASRYPITRAVQIGRGVADRREMTRYPLYASVDVPWSEEDPSFVAVHLKAGTTRAEQFRRAVEAHRIREFLEKDGPTQATSNVMILGDFNEDREGVVFQPASFRSDGVGGGYRFADGSTLPASYRLGSDLEQGLEPLPYGPFPARAFAGLGMADLGPLQADGRSRATFNLLADVTLDYLLVNEAWLERGNAHAEIYNSAFDATNDGLFKSGMPLERWISEAASDHHALFADLPLDTLPRLALHVSQTRLREGDGGVTGSVALPGPSEGDLVICLETGSRGHARLSQTELRLTKGVDSVNFIVAPIADGVADPDHRLTIRASASGYSADVVFLDILNEDVSGRLLVSRYREPAAGASGKGIELLNNTVSTIDFADTPLDLLIYADGQTDAFLEVSLSRGRLEAGKVLVVGDPAVENYLRREGLVHEALVVADGDGLGTVYLSETGEAVFIGDALRFDGDDAIEVQLGRSRSDVFGAIGSDPGRGWIRRGVSTVDSTLVLRPMAAFGSNGFTDPGTRFSTVPFSQGLAGFGVPPAVEPDYRDWLAAEGIPSTASAFDDDFDKDGLTNLAEFAFVADPSIPTASVFSWTREGADRLMIQFRRRVAPISISLEVSPDLRVWRPLEVPVSEAVEPVTEGIRQVTWTFAAPSGPSRFYRFHVVLWE